MSRYVLLRILMMVPTLLGITLITFLVVHLAPGDPIHQGDAQFSANPLSPAEQQAVREQFRLDQPIMRRYLLWVRDVLTLDFGQSFHDGRPVRAHLAERLPRTLAMGTAAACLAFGCAVPLAVALSRRRGGQLDRIATVASFTLYAIPGYLVATALILLVGVQLNWLPVMGWRGDGYDSLGWMARAGDVVRHGALPAICLALPIACYTYRVLRSSLAAAWQEDYVLTARALGASERCLAWRHVLPNAALPLLTTVGLILPGVISGAVIIEVMFSWPGAGHLLHASIVRHDYPVIIALASVSALIVLVGTLVVDVLYAWADPRVRYR